MRIIQESQGYEGTEFYRITVDEPVSIHFSKQIDDLLISSPKGDVLISWDMDEWDDSQCMLVKSFDNLKEFGNLRCTKLLLKSYTGEPIEVFCTVQRN